MCPFRARIWPFQAPKTLHFRGKMANFEAENTIKQGKNAKRTNGTHVTRVHPSPPNQQNDGFHLEFLFKGPQTELRTLSQNYEQTLQKLRTNRIMNKRAFLKLWKITAGFLYRAGAETPLNFRCSQKDFEKILSGGSGIHRWGLDLSTGYPNTYFSWFSGYTQLILVFLPGDKQFCLFSRGACREN